MCDHGRDTPVEDQDPDAGQPNFPGYPKGEEPISKFTELSDTESVPDTASTVISAAASTAPKSFDHINFIAKDEGCEETWTTYVKLRNSIESVSRTWPGKEFNVVINSRRCPIHHDRRFIARAFDVELKDNVARIKSVRNEDKKSVLERLDSALKDMAKKAKPKNAATWPTMKKSTKK